VSLESQGACGQSSSAMQGTLRAVPVSHTPQLQQKRPVTTSHLHTDPRFSAGKRGSTPCPSSNMPVCGNRKGTGTRVSLRAAAPPPRLTPTALSQGFEQKAGSTCLDFIIIWADFQHTAIFRNEITAFIYNFSLKLHRFRTASYYAARHRASGPQPQ